MQQELETRFLNILDSDKERIFRICRTYASDADDAHDIFQEVVLQIWKALPDFKGLADVRTWVYRITLNVCLRSNYKLQKRKKKHVQFDSVTLENVEDPLPDMPGQEAAFAALYACIQQLNETDRSIVLLFLEDLPYKEIAAITGLTENHVSVKIKRIKIKLSTCIKQICDVR
ncbi:RNA polymerase sigma factor [Pontibacter sp. SGAir0037]|uniref:RNA polymerase sigma factor n=1 Tax=Pontibacter sp. SGAir0037 TaxID=2571030 RepID=UPI0010CD2D9B|nr:sigma-70 family RNA polymerase sigma factor [Pontibacter sp. SGAir0037]QCR21255.1 RNA polymerase [Pontibacter sp. SGAir0037]